MYASCTYCYAPLRRNGAIEPFPVGRRLAFDAERGRLWVVCLRCARWNLSPLEARFEAVEACERAYRGTRLRVATENVGLARLRDGTELVRVGRPLRPELAAWRYGDAFLRRRRRWLVRRAAVATAQETTSEAATVAFALVSPPLLIASLAVASVLRNHEERRVAAFVPDDSGRWLLVRVSHLREARLESGGGSGHWCLSISHSPVVDRRSADRDVRASRLSGAAARAALAAHLPAINAAGGERGVVDLAVQRLEHAGDASRYVDDTIGRALAARRHRPEPTLALSDVTPSVLLALEMASHEEAERRALEGELAALEAAWRDAEEVARIADDLLVPTSVRRALDRLRGAR